MQDSVTCNMHASLYYEYGMMLCINTPAPELRDVISAGRTLSEGWRSDDVEVTVSAEEKRRETRGKRTTRLEKG